MFSDNFNIALQVLLYIHYGSETFPLKGQIINIAHGWVTAKLREHSISSVEEVG